MATAVPTIGLLCLLVGVIGFENPPTNVVSHINDDWFLFGDSRSDCNHINNINPKNYSYMDLDPSLCNSGKISSKAGNSIFRSFHFTDFYNYQGEGNQIIFYEGVNFSPSHGFKCTTSGDNGIWIDNKGKFYEQVYRKMAIYRSLSIVTVPYVYAGSATANPICKSGSLTLDNPASIQKENGVVNYLYTAEANFTLSNCDEYIVPLCIYTGMFRASGAFYNDSQYYYSYSTGEFYGRNNTVDKATVVDYDCQYLTLPSGIYKSVSNQLLLTVPTKAICLTTPKSFTPVQVVDSRWNHARTSDNKTAEACQLPYCYFRNSTTDYVGSYDINHGDVGFSNILKGLTYNAPCFAKQGVFIYNNVSSVWPAYAYGECPTAASININGIPICNYDPLPVILLGILLGIAVITIVVLLLYFLVDNGTRLHDA